MMQFRLASGVLAASLLMAGASQAQDKPVGRLTHLPAGTLLRLCQSPQTVKVCDAYVSGIADGITLVESAAGPNTARKVCIPQATGTQLRSTVVAWMSKHSDRLSADVGPVAYDALTEAFPCGAGAGGKP
jgi:hypothetical protein